MFTSAFTTTYVFHQQKISSKKLFYTYSRYQYINIIWFCFHWLAMSNSCYNPFIYAIYSVSKYIFELNLYFNTDIKLKIKYACDQNTYTHIFLFLCRKSDLLKITISHNIAVNAYCTTFLAATRVKMNKHFNKIVYLK